ncbi:MAG: amino acid ABC transporter permease [Bifidobacteriaceae bacterium]|jgi:glutamate transport system permease protein|nr:amino acid ABC transporter permease [Bifidobacteriaceae bacterium]MCI1978409.1 amino acid ABC transporter permease [Bifidobacteriaceae bacterium]
MSYLSHTHGSAHRKTVRMSAPTTQDALFEVSGPRARRWIRIGTALSIVLLAGLLFLIYQQFAFSGQLDEQYWFFFGQFTTWTFIAQGLLGTVKVAVVAGILAIIVGLLLMTGRISHFAPLRWVCRLIIDVARGVPSLLFIYFFFLVLPTWGLTVSTYWMVTIPISFNAAGVLAEVFRSGVNAVPTGQSEAATSLGLSRGQAFRGVILPQAIRYVIPTLVTQLVVVVKDTTFGYVVTYPEMMQNAKVLISNYNSLVPVYLVTAIIYILINYLLSRLARYISKRTGAKIEL